MSVDNPYDYKKRDEAADRATRLEKMATIIMSGMCATGTATYENNAYCAVQAAECLLRELEKNYERWHY